MSQSRDLEAGDTVILTWFGSDFRIARLLMQVMVPHKPERVFPTKETRERLEFDGYVCEVLQPDAERASEFKIAADQLEELGFDGPAVALLRAAARIRP